MDILEFAFVYLFGGIGTLALIWYSNKKAKNKMTLKEGMLSAWGWFFAVIFFIDVIAPRRKSNDIEQPQKKPFNLEEFFKGE